MNWTEQDGQWVSETPAGNIVTVFPDRQWWKFTSYTPEGMVESGWWHSLEWCKEGVERWVEDQGPARPKGGVLRPLIAPFTKLGGGFIWADTILCEPVNA